MRGWYLGGGHGAQSLGPAPRKVAASRRAPVFIHRTKVSGVSDNSPAPFPPLLPACRCLSLDEPQAPLGNRQVIKQVAVAYPEHRLKLCRRVPILREVNIKHLIKDG